MIEKIEVKIHDKFQLEIDTLYNFVDDKAPIDMDMFMFLPKSLNINFLTYPKYLFYRNIKEYIRFSSRKIHLKDSEQFIDEIKRISEIQNIDECERATREFVCGLESIIRIFLLETSDENIEYILETFYEKYSIISNYFYKELVEKQKIPKVNLIYEYLNFGSQQKILKVIKNHEKFVSESLKIKLENLLIKEKIEDYELQDYVYRHRLMKKYIQSSLFLNVAKKVDGKLTEHIAFGIAALITMAIITAVTVSYSSRFSLQYILLVAVAYAFKDRMKDSFRSIFYKKMSRNIPDYITTISSEINEKLATIKEFYQIFTDNQVPKEIYKIRIRNHDIKRVQEDVIRYNKFIIPNNKCTHKRLIRNLIFLDIKHYLAKMDDPEDFIFFYDKGEIIQKECDKEYHLNMVIRVKQNKKIMYQLFQIILDRNGLIEINEK